MSCLQELTNFSCLLHQLSSMGCTSDIHEVPFLDVNSLSQFLPVTYMRSHFLFSQFLPSDIYEVPFLDVCSMSSAHSVNSYQVTYMRCHFIQSILPCSLQVLERVSGMIPFLKESTKQLSSSSESLGAVRQETRVSDLV